MYVVISSFVDACVYFARHFLRYVVVWFVRFVFHYMLISLGVPSLYSD